MCAAPSLVQRVDHLAEDVELELSVRRVADADGTRALVAGEPGHFPLEEPTLAAEAVHDLRLVGAAGGGAQQPVAPGAGLVVVARVHQRDERQAWRRAASRVGSPSCESPPISSGSDVVAAATRPPVGAYVSALSVSRERSTGSRNSPS